MRERYVVLRTDPGPSPEILLPGFRGRMPRRESPLRLELSVDELDAKQVAELARDPSITTAPDMPVELIAPRAVTALPNDVDALDPVAWGLDTVGATKSLLDGSGVVV